MALSPEASMNIVRSYRSLYQSRYNGEIYSGTSESIIQFWTNASGAPTIEDCDNWVLENMHSAEHPNC